MGTPPPAELRLGVLLPRFYPPAAGGASIDWSPLFGVHQALLELNNKSDGVADDLLPHTRLAFAYRDSQCDASAALSAALDLTVSAFGGRGVSALIGAGCSSASLTTALVARGSRTPVVSPTSTSPALSGGAENAYFFRTCPSDAFTADGLVDILVHLLNYSVAALVHTADAYGAGVGAAFAAAARRAGVRIALTQVLAPPEDESSYDEHHAALWRSRARVIALFTGDVAMGFFMRTALRAGVGGEGYVWLAGDGGASASLWLADATLAADARLRERTFRGLLSLVPDGRPQGAAYEAYLARRAALPSTEGGAGGCSPQTDDEGNLLWQAAGRCAGFSAAADGPYDAYGYDAVYALARAAHALVEAGAAVDGAALREALFGVSFQGITGAVRFHRTVGSAAYEGDRRVGLSYTLLSYASAAAPFVVGGRWRPCQTCAWAERWAAAAPLAFSTPDNTPPPPLGECPAGQRPAAGAACECAAAFAPSGGGYCRRCAQHTSGRGGGAPCAACAAGRYRLDGAVASTASCEASPRGAVCAYNATLSTLAAARGYWRLSAASATFYACGGRDGATPCVGGAAGCAAGHAGPLCRVCVDADDYFDGAACRAARAAHHARAFAAGVGLVPKLKLGLAFLQVLAVLDSTYAIRLPDAWFRWTRTLRLLGDIDWTSWVVPSACLVGGLKEELLLRALVPLALILSIPPLGAAFSRLSRGTTCAQGACAWLPASLVLSFCLTASVSASTFRAWHCISFSYDGAHEHAFLAGQLSIRCDGSAEHRAVLAVAWALVAIWPVGMVLTYAILLVPCRKLLLDETFDSPLVRATTFLHRDYKPSYCWWEVASLLQRTILTGWLLLIDDAIAFMRLVAALILSIAFLVLLLQCRPYRRLLDHAMATGCQLLLVCIFLGGILVRLYEDVVHDPDGSAALAYRLLGLRSSDQAVVLMISVAFSMLLLLASIFLAEWYAFHRKRKREQQWSICTMDPPYMKWKPTGVYACFLSHYKMEAASDARYMHDMLRKMLQAPVFLDSSTLTDLRNLFTEGVHKSDTLVVLATKNVLSRHWCLLELLETARRNIPVVVVQMANGGFSFEEARDFVEDFEASMARLNPAGLEFLRTRLHADFGELKAAVSRALDASELHPLVFDAQAGDKAMVGSMQDVAEQMALATGRKVTWQEVDAGHSRKLRAAPFGKRSIVLRRLSSRLSFLHHSLELGVEKAVTLGGRRHGSHTAVVNKESAVFVCCSRDDALRHARVLRADLAVKLGRGCAVGGGADTAPLIDESDLLVALLTKRLLTDPHCLHEIWLALERGVPLVTVAISGGGYDYERAAEILADLPAALEHADASRLQGLLPTDASVSDVAVRLQANLSSIIALSWNPHARRNQQHAVVDEIVARMPPRASKSWALRLPTQSSRISMVSTSRRSKSSYHERSTRSARSKGSTHHDDTDGAQQESSVSQLSL
ncbi:hypothetical protein AB1Y20_020356 [Prymnesium parvum]|uniref:Receptor ligand binding region domain-containing protein n=1 Tax=Prymnesium parvum TaxID=97485 RepID=A0AB34JV18_PRYPA